VFSPEKLNRLRFPSPQRRRGARGEGASTRLTDPGRDSTPHPALGAACVSTLSDSPAPPPPRWDEGAESSLRLQRTSTRLTCHCNLRCSRSHVDDVHIVYLAVGPVNEGGNDATAADERTQSRHSHRPLLVFSAMPEFERSLIPNASPRTHTAAQTGLSAARRHL
jgi:hypothetical protein